MFQGHGAIRDISVRGGVFHVPGQFRVGRFGRFGREFLGDFRFLGKKEVLLSDRFERHATYYLLIPVARRGSGRYRQNMQSSTRIIAAASYGQPAPAEAVSSDLAAEGKRLGHAAGFRARVVSLASLRG